MSEQKDIGFRFRPMGDKALLIELEEIISPEVNKKVRALSHGIEQAGIPGILEIVPAYRTLAVYYDPLTLTYNELCSQILRIEKELLELRLPKPRVFYIPVCYGGEMGPDLPYVAAHNGLTEDEAIAVHTAGTYLVYMIGFLPGFPYLGGMSQKLATPRLPEPRTKVPAGSVGIAGNQTGIYPIESPGGWRIIGRTPIKLFIPEKEPPVLLAVGDLVKFFAITVEEYHEIAAKVELGEYEVKVEVTEENGY